MKTSLKFLSLIIRSTDWSMIHPSSIMLNEFYTFSNVTRFHLIWRCHKSGFIVKVTNILYVTISWPEYVLLIMHLIESNMKFALYINISITRLSHTFETAGMNKIINSIWFRYAHHVYMWQLIEFLLFLAWPTP